MWKLHLGSCVIGFVTGLLGFPVFDFATSSINWPGVAVLLLSLLVWILVYFNFLED